jgi:predicted LPLAT superfamily acyltransferase
MRFGAFCYRALGRRLAEALAHVVVAYFFATDRAGRAASAAYLRRVYATPVGAALLGRPPGAWQSFLHYRAFALSIVDRMDIWCGRADDFEFHTHGIESFHRLRAQGRGALVLGAHLGSFDALRLLADRSGFKANVLMFTANAERINTVFRELSPASEARVIQVEPSAVQTVFAIRECLRRGELVCMLSDRVEPGSGRRTCIVPLLGSPVELPQAPFLLAHLLGCPVVLMLGLRTGPRRYEIFAEMLAERVTLPRSERERAVEERVRDYAGRLERHCLEAPFQWFNFYDYWGDADR